MTNLILFFIHKYDKLKQMIERRNLYANRVTTRSFLTSSNAVIKLTTADPLFCISQKPFFRRRPQEE